jgi:predicted dehydrogenase
MGMISNHCKLGVVGAGAMAREHLRAFQGLPGVELVGIYSRTRSRAEKLAAEFQISGVFDSIAALYYECGANLAVVTVPELAMRGICSECFRFPWAMLLEKPVGYDWDDAVAIEAESRSAGIKAWVGLNRRWLASTRTMIADLEMREGTRFIHIQDQQNQAAARSAGQPDLVVRNWMYANSIHLVDYLRLLGRGPIVGVTKVIPWKAAKPGVVVAKVEFESGDEGLYEGIWHGPGPWAVSVSTAERRWELRPLERARFQNSGERQVHETEPDTNDISFKPGFRNQARLVVAAVGGVDSGLPTITEALESMRLIRDIFEEA